MSVSRYSVEFDPPESGYTMVPNAMLDDPRLTIEARAALAWMASKPRGFKLAVADAMSTLGIGRDRWQRIARELRQVGALERIPVRGLDGKIAVWIHRISWAPWVSTQGAGSTSLKSRHVARQVPENPVPPHPQNPGFPAAQVPENPVPYKDYKQNSSNGEGAHARDGQRAHDASEILARKAQWINSGRAVPGSLCRPDEVRELIARGLITPEKAREAGLR